MSGITLHRAINGRVQVSDQVLSVMLGFVQDSWWKPEAGGVLMGRQIRDCEDIVVDEVSTPMKGDKRSRFMFIRGARLHQDLLIRKWRESGGTCTYLGEWHTHPEPTPTPSCLDVREWKRKLSRDSYAGDSLFFIIVGTERLRVWEGRRCDANLSLIGDIDFAGRR